MEKEVEKEEEEEREEGCGKERSGAHRSGTTFVDDVDQASNLPCLINRFSLSLSFLLFNFLSLSLSLSLSAYLFKISEIQKLSLATAKPSISKFS